MRGITPWIMLLFLFLSTPIWQHSVHGLRCWVCHRYLSLQEEPGHQNPGKRDRDRKPSMRKRRRKNKKRVTHTCMAFDAPPIAFIPFEILVHTIIINAHSHVNPLPQYLMKLAISGATRSSTGRTATPRKLPCSCPLFLNPSPA